MTRDSLTDEAVRRAPEWAIRHLLEALLDPSPQPCAQCEAAAEAIRIRYRALLREPFFRPAPARQAASL